MTDVPLVAGLVEICEKHFGPKTAKAILGLILLTTVLVCIGHILNSCLIPTYHVVVMAIQDRERIVIPPREMFDLALKGFIAGGLYLIIFWAASLPARLIAHKIEIQAQKTSREIDNCKEGFADLKKSVFDLSSCNFKLQTSIVSVLNAYIGSLERIKNSKQLPKLENDGDLVNLYKTRESLRESLAVSADQVKNQNLVLEPEFKILMPSSTAHKSASPTEPT